MKEFIFREVEFKRYDHTTQIVSLPGGVKRTHTEINDNAKEAKIKVHHSYNTKVIRDYNSNISCLPGSRINNLPERPVTHNIRRYQSSDIFNIGTPSSTNYNSFNKKANTYAKNNIFAQSNNEKKLVPHPKSHRPDNIRNVFVSQIQII